MTDWLIDAARRPYNLDPELPEGLAMIGGRPQFPCRSCGQWTVWEGELKDFEPDYYANVCGGSPRCCP
jgi:hypothetical protein